MPLLDAMCGVAVEAMASEPGERREELHRLQGTRVADGFDDVAGSGFAFGPDHGSALSNPSQSLA